MIHTLIRCGARAIVLEYDGAGTYSLFPNDPTDHNALELTRLEAHGLALALTLALTDPPVLELDGGTILYDARAGTCKLIDDGGSATGWEVQCRAEVPR